MISFARIRARAEKRKGGAAMLATLLPAAAENGALATLGDDRVLSCMAKRIFSAGFVWKVVDQKWPAFEEAFLGFAPKPLLFQPDDFWDGLAGNAAIIRNGQKIQAVRENAAFVVAVSEQHGGFGAFLAAWPADDQIGLLGFLARGGARLGGNTGFMFLRFVGWDAFVLSDDVVACLRDAGLDIAEGASSQRDRLKIQAQFNCWRRETGLSYRRLSRICSLSIGENLPVEKLRAHDSET